MAWAEQWTYKVDGVHINGQGSGLITSIPDIENGFDDEVVSVAVDGREPAYIRNQPVAGLYTILIDAGAVSWATWQTRMDFLRALLTKGPHTLTVQARGMAAEKSCTIVVRGWVPSAKERRVAYQAVVMKPIVF